MASRSMRTRVSMHQLEMLCDFLTRHPEVAKAYNRSLQAKAYAQRKWTELSEALNSDGLGAHKDWRGWSKYWVDYKAKLKNKTSALRASLTQTGGGPSIENKMDDLDKRFLQILGEDVGQGLPGIRVEPFPMSVISSEGNVGQAENDSACILPEQIEDMSPEHSQPVQVEDLHVLHPQPAHCPTEAAPPVISEAPLQRGRPIRRRRRDSVMTQESARRSLVSATQLRAEAAVRSAEAMEAMSRSIVGIENSLLRIER